MPNGNRLPGEQNTAPTDLKPTAPNPSGATPDSPSTSAFEETNLKIQHILTAETPAGQLARIDVEVPVLYQSRNLRWTPEDVAEARQLLARLTDYQDKSQQLRASATNLLDAWNRLISRSLPASELRADSPSLPSNQKDAANAPLSSGLITTESIQIQPAEK
jgi:hypothetical protein